MTDALTTYVLTVLADHGGSTPGLVIQPGDERTYEQVSDRLIAVAFHRLRPWEWTHRHWTVSPTSGVDVVDGCLVRVTTGSTSIGVGPLRLTPQWRSAAHERRALVVLVPAGTVRSADMTADAIDGVLLDAVKVRAAVAGLAKVRFAQFAGHRPS